MKTRFKEKVEQAIGHAMSHTKPYDWDNVFIDAVSKITAYHQDDINELKVKFKELFNLQESYIKFLDEYQRDNAYPMGIHDSDNQTIYENHIGDLQRDINKLIDRIEGTDTDENTKDGDTI